MLCACANRARNRILKWSKDAHHSNTAAVIATVVYSGHLFTHSMISIMPIMLILV